MSEQPLHLKDFPVCHKHNLTNSCKHFKPIGEGQIYLLVVKAFSNPQKLFRPSHMLVQISSAKQPEGSNGRVSFGAPPKCGLLLSKHNNGQPVRVALACIWQMWIGVQLESLSLGN